MEHPDFADPQQTSPPGTPAQERSGPLPKKENSPDVRTGLSSDPETVDLRTSSMRIPRLEPIVNSYNRRPQERTSNGYRSRRNMKDSNPERTLSQVFPKQESQRSGTIIINPKESRAESAKQSPQTPAPI